MRSRHASAHAHPWLSYRPPPCQRRVLRRRSGGVYAVCTSRYPAVYGAFMQGLGLPGNNGTAVAERGTATAVNHICTSPGDTAWEEAWKGLVSAESLSWWVWLSRWSPVKAAQPYAPSMPDPVLEPWRWQTFPELRGLGLRCMAEDRQGRMWFGADEGVRCYDGLSWKVYTPEDGVFGAPVTRLCAARGGGVYAGTEVGVSRFWDGEWRRLFPSEGGSALVHLRSPGGVGWEPVGRDGVGRASSGRRLPGDPGRLLA